MSNNPPAPITVEITGLAAGGSCVGNVIAPESDAGKKAFVPYTIPGEQVTAAITKDKKAFFNAEPLTIDSPSPFRTTAPCPVFGKCGGCDLQHITLPHQRELKRQMVEDLLRVQGGFEPTEGVSVLGSELPGFEYRRRMSFHLNKKGEFGLYRKNGRQIVEVDHCPISTAPINAFLKENLHLVKACTPEIETVTVEDHAGVIFLALEVHPRNSDALPSLRAKPEFSELESRVPNLQVNYRHKAIYHASERECAAPPVGHFSQNNELANEEMLNEILRLVKGAERVTDLYAGSGNISLPIAIAGHTVTAVEVDPYLVAFGQKRAAAAGLTDRLTFETKSCEKWIEKGSPDKTVVLDPPRGGAYEVALRLDPNVSSSIVYVSCYPPTFARDAKALIERGYTLEKVQVLDMFPQTYHAELIAHFTAR